MHLRKYHGLGNDFLILVDPDGKQPVDADLARAVCDRHRGVGADGLIRLTGGLRGPNAVDVPLTMELLNADGSRAETSGNGLRCVALAVVDSGLAAGPDLTVVTDAGPRRLTLHDDGIGDWNVSVDMGEARIEGRRVDLGNPHEVVFVEQLTVVSGPRPGVNVEYVAFGPGDHELSMRVFERGVGETEACGSGACAAAAVGYAEHRVTSPVTVHQPGGDVTVDVSGPTIVLTGPAAFICEVEYPWP